MRVTSEFVDEIAAHSDTGHVEGLADRLNDVLAGEEAADALMAIALLLAAIPIKGEERTCAYGAIVTLASAHANRADTLSRH